MAAEGHDSNPLSHVVDHPTIEIPIVGKEVDLPKIGGFQVTRFMVMEVVAALLIAAIVIPLARHVARRRVTKGRFFHIFEAIVVFIRDGIARPTIDGGHEEHPHPPGVQAHDVDHELIETVGVQDAELDTVAAPKAGKVAHEHGHGHGPGHGRTSDLFLPFLWTLFFFVLFCNLMGMLPGGASATGSISVTATLAFLTLCAVVTAGVRAFGPGGFWINLVPKLDVPAILKPPLWGLMFVIEVAGLLIRHVVLSVRLFANMLAGHIVLAVILGFIAMAVGWATYLVTPASVLGAVGISLLELFVAFLQAYIFTFLAALFIGSVSHAH
jgi:F-type H+-transporting ATPase subunit a